MVYSRLKRTNEALNVLANIENFEKYSNLNLAFPQTIQSLKDAIGNNETFSSKLNNLVKEIEKKNLMCKKDLIDFIKDNEEIGEKGDSTIY